MGKRREGLEVGKGKMKNQCHISVWILICDIEKECKDCSEKGREEGR